MRSLQSLLLVTLLVGPAQGQESSWEKIREEAGVKVYTQESQSELKVCRGVAVVNAAPERVLWVLADSKHRTEWVEGLAVNRVLEQVSPFEFVIYQAFAMPWFLTDRDFVFRARVEREVEGGSIHVSLTSCKHPAEPKTVGIRAQLLHSSYTLTPLDGGTRTLVEVKIQADPKGWLPAWVVNRWQEKWPLQVLTGIKEQVRRPYVDDYPLPPPAKSIH